MKKILIAILSASAALISVFSVAPIANAATCWDNYTCGWVDVTNVSDFGVPAGSGNNFYNDGPTADYLCQLKGYDSYTYYANIGKWKSPGDNYLWVWKDNTWNNIGHPSSKWLAQIYCAKKVVTNTPPTITWTSAPQSVECNATYTVSVSAHDADGNLSAVSIDKNNTPFAYADGGNGTDGTSGNPTSDTGPQKVIYTAWATDSVGGVSDKISTVVNVGACTAPPQDLCPNISGTQSSVPDGMVIDSSGNCVSSTPANKQPVGVLDSATCSSLNGWAYDPDTPSSSIDVHVYVNGGFATAANANGSRPDVDAAFNITGNHGYSISTPSAAMTGSPALIQIYAIDSAGGPNPLIGQSTITCSPPSPAPTGLITASPSSVPSSGGNTTVSWASLNATTCTASGGWSGTKTTSGSETVSITPPQTLNIKCSGSGGDWNGSVTVNASQTNPPVNPPSNVTASLSVTPTCAVPNTPVTFTSTAGGSPINSHIIEKDSNQDGVFGTLKDFGAAGGTQTYTTTLGAGLYDFRTAVNNSVYSGTTRVTVANSCNNNANNNPGNTGTTGTTGTSGTNGNTGNSGNNGNSQPSKCTDPNASNFGQVGSCVYPSFSLTADPSTVRAKSLAGFSGVTEKDINLSINPVGGFTAPVFITVDQSSLPTGIKPEFSFAGGDFKDASQNPGGTLSWDGSFFRNNGIIFLPVRIRFGGTLQKDANYVITFKGIPQAGGTGSNASPATATVTIDSKPRYPGFQEQ
ncbi:MAG TPA: hypothetical protein VFT82_02240 [Candidatus Paceibacterota bacterium]|nr:hypothetical protein [Candidatus Paceibacterota bacterium]